MESQVLKEWTAQADKEGVKKGQRLVLLRILRRIQANLPDDLERAVQGVDDPDRLNAIVDTALSSATIDDFRRATGL